ncbi:MAG: succinate dehydrogenase hydrophobic membrane anchor subunit [Prosthecochloris sp.]|uniref:Succinate dehydrogenase, membrane subunit, putative n=1 Tax=Prosthecochloris aestuarii (strain DSM 271 / SK 413) TaxID=290512 RepID=B4S6F5_PROA2|nr:MULTISPECIES: succinate dehydrogenase hydrophobic membrane anchor subunit [Prosthecochloris]ACF47257.1 succinate dehydrogenase, membrane subunit, putative [Prosthecochloris aestuarii DSM 271]MCW8797695.1 succinate dehydrogenase hydrophobic membrane anchor subunit [Prosthecochloris sp.]
MNQSLHETPPVTISSKIEAFGWVMQRFTGLGLVLFLALHFWVQHMPNGYLATATEYNDIVAEFATKSPEYAEAIADGHIKEALPEEHVITYSSVAARLANPLWKAIDIMLLLFALAHGLNGLNNVLVDYVQRAALRKALFAGSLAVCLFLSVQGIASILAAGSGA